MLVYLIILCLSYNLTYAMESGQELTFTLHHTQVSALLLSIQKLDKIKGSNPFVVNQNNISINPDKNTITVKNVPPEQQCAVKDLLEWLDMDSSEWNPVSLNILPFGNQDPQTPYEKNPIEEMSNL